jgi:hypothetical protein
MLNQSNWRRRQSGCHRGLASRLFHVRHCCIRSCISIVLLMVYCEQQKSLWSPSHLLIKVQRSCQLWGVVVNPSNTTLCCVARRVALESWHGPKHIPYLRNIPTVEHRIAGFHHFWDLCHISKESQLLHLHCDNLLCLLDGAVIFVDKMNLTDFLHSIFHHITTPFVLVTVIPIGVCWASSWMNLISSKTFMMNESYIGMPWIVIAIQILDASHFCLMAVVNGVINVPWFKPILLETILMNRNFDHNKNAITTTHRMLPLCAWHPTTLWLKISNPKLLAFFPCWWKF